ncbi:MAG: hypothetical protein R2719_13295 [Micropruina sp.]
MLAGVLLVAVVWLFLLRYVPERAIWIQGERAPGTARPSGGIFIPGQADQGRSRPSAGSRWRCCWCSAWWAAGSSPDGCSRR